MMSISNLTIHMTNGLTYDYHGAPADVERHFYTWVEWRNSLESDRESVLIFDKLFVNVYRQPLKVAISPEDIITMSICDE